MRPVLFELLSFPHLQICPWQNPKPTTDGGLELDLDHRPGSLGAPGKGKLGTSEKSPTQARNCDLSLRKLCQLTGGG